MSELEKKLRANDDPKELSKVKVGNQVYNLKDAQVRIDLVEEEARAKAEEAKKLEAYTVSVAARGGQYTGVANVPVYFDTEPTVNDIKVNAYSIALNTTKEQTAVKNSLTVPAASTVTAGLMSAADKAKLDGMSGDVDGKIAKEKAERVAADNSEAETRATKDTELSNAIDAEETARDTADKALDKKIEDEATARATEDGKLSERINALESKGRYLSTWDATTGQPDTYPEVAGDYPKTYKYRSGDYYIVNKVAASGNLMPKGSEITKESAEEAWDIPSEAFTGTNLNLGDQFQFDGTKWTYIASATTVAFKNIQGDAEENENLKGKLDTLRTADATLQANINAEEAARIDADATKVDKQVVGTNGTAKIFNESDGGGAQFVGANGVVAYVGTHDSIGGEIGTQIYVDKANGTESTIIDVTQNGAYYTKGTIVPGDQRDIPANEIAVKGDVSAVSDDLTLEIERAKTEEAKKLDKATAKVANVVFGDDQEITVAELEAAGSLNLKGLSHADTATGSTTLDTIDSITLKPITVAGSGTITNTPTSATVTFTAYTPSGKVTIPEATEGETNIFQPAGTNADSNVTVTTSGDTFVKAINAGTVPAATYQQGTKAKLTTATITYVESSFTVAPDETDAEMLVFTNVTAKNASAVDTFTPNGDDTFNAEKIPEVSATADALTGITSAIAAGQVFTGKKYAPKFTGDSADILVSEVTYDKTTKVEYSTEVTPETATITRTAKTISITVQPD